MEGAGSRGRVERPLTKLVHESVRELATIARLDAIGNQVPQPTGRLGEAPGALAQVDIVIRRSPVVNDRGGWAPSPQLPAVSLRDER